MATIGDVGAYEVGAAALHFVCSGGTEEIGILATDKGEREARERVEERPEVGHGLRASRKYRIAERRVIVDLQTIGCLDVVFFDLFAPTAFGDVFEPFQKLGAHSGGFRVGFLDRVFADVVLDDIEACCFKRWAHIDEADASEAVFGGEAKEERDQAAARRSEDRDFVDLEVVEEGECVACLGRYGVGVCTGPRGLAATAVVEADEANTLKMRSDIVEVGAVAGETCEGKDGDAVTFVCVEQLCAVGSRECWH